MTSQIEIITALRAQVLRLEAANRTVDDPILKTPWKGLNRILPQGGICRGRLMEWIGSGLGSGAGTLALLVGRQVCADGGTLVVVDRPGCFYPPAALALGILCEQLLIVRPTNDADEIWAIDQSLRCEAVSVVWSYTERMPARAFRRLQLSAEEGRGIGMPRGDGVVRHHDFRALADTAQLDESLSVLRRLDSVVLVQNT